MATCTSTLPPVSIVELRQYTLKAHRRDELIELFEREFVGPQHDVGAFVLGAFRDLDDPDRFVWLRGFETLQRRAEALATFYDGPVWGRHGAAANDTMLDSDDVLLLRCRDRVQWDRSDGAALVTADVFALGDVDPVLFGRFFDAAVAPLRRSGAEALGTLVSADVPNDFPRLPVREGESVFVAMDVWSDERAAASTAAPDLAELRDAAPATVLPALMREPERLRLQPAFRLPAG